MKRALLSQITNDWKENIWLIVELLVVSLVIWYLTVILLRDYRISRISMGSDIENVYAADIRLIDEDENPILFFYTSQLEEDLRSRLTENMQAMLDRIKELPMVEYAALGSNALPYNLNHAGNYLKYLSGSDTMVIYANTRSITPEGAQVLKLESRSGKSPGDLRKFLENGELLVGPSMEIDMYGKERGVDIEALLGAKLIGTFSPYEVGGLINDVRRYQYEQDIVTGTVITPVLENTSDILNLDNLLIRIKPGSEKDFEKAMESEPSIINPHDIVLSKLRPLTNDRRLITWNNETSQRKSLLVIVFLLTIVFIGLLGTFWYRVYLRTSEIAVRKTFGATDLDIFRRLTGEAFILLLLAIIMSTLIVVGAREYLESGLFSQFTRFNTWHTDMILAGVLTLIIMSLLIISGVAIPAFRAMKIQPAEALKQE